MRSFLGVPISSPEGVIGAFYLTEKLGAAEFTTADQGLIELLAAHAAIAITNARLYEESRELSILSERNRLALELHDAVSQKLFSLVLNAEVAATLVERDAGAAAAQLAKLQTLAQQALEELRALIFELRPPDLERDGLCGALRKHVGVLAQRGGEVSLELDAEGAGDPARDAEILRIAQEALANALRHSQAEHVAVRLRAEAGRLLLEVEDDGVGFEPTSPEARSRRLGLTSMEERARRLRGRLEIDSAPGRGTAVQLAVPLDRRG
jgi:signal transduction histidine kinase